MGHHRARRTSTNDDGVVHFGVSLCFALLCFALLCFAFLPASRRTSARVAIVMSQQSIEHILRFGDYANDSTLTGRYRRILGGR
jgi:hypothetical protein